MPKRSGRIGTVDRIVGQIIRRRRVEANITQDALGAACNCSYQQIQKYEYGANRLSLAVLVKMAMGLGCSATDIVHEVEEKLAEASG